ncbi:MAG: LCP family protein, partial [Candidatus Magasanikbacteria bacterium]|nr:LCP family protein [Candidatus Magasanikbacteria bacterium]
GVFFIGGGWLWYRLSPAEAPDNPAVYDPITLEPKRPEGFLRRLTNFVFSKPVTLSGQRLDRINILLLGIGGLGHDGPYLTDTMILVSIKPSTKQIAMVSIPRDLAVDIPGRGSYKINHADAFGEVERAGWGGALATRVVESTFGVDIPYYVRLDFAAFVEIIDEVGGIKVNVERSFVDAEYPAPNFAFQTVSFAKGIQMMNGQRALQYARSRHGGNGEGSDFARARRQQKMLLALKEKLLSFSTLSNPVRINKVMNSLDTHLTTNMTFADIITLIKLGREWHADQITTLVLDSTPEGYLQNTTGADGAFLLQPKGGDFTPIREAVKGIFDRLPTVADDTPTQEAPAAPTVQIEIQNGTWRAGLAARIKKRLTDKQLTVTRVGNMADRPISTSVIYATRPASADIAHIMGVLRDELGVPIEETVPNGITMATDTDVLLVLGEDIKE